MLYGSNILSAQPADWDIQNGSMSTSMIDLNTGGTAFTTIKHTSLQAIPSSLLLTLIPEHFTNSYAPSAIVKMEITTAEDVNYEYNIPIVATKEGFCYVEIPANTTEFITFSFSIHAIEPIQIFDWALYAPKSELVDLSEVEAKIPRLLADYNTSTTTVGQRESTVALISAILLSNIDVEGQLQITYIASDACTITLRFKDNNGTELFAPLLYDVLNGKGSLGVAHAYLKRLAGMHTFIVTAQCTVGTISFNTRSILYSIDAGYLATREIDIDTDIQDISVRRLHSESAPSYIYVVGIDRDKVIRVRRRPYSEQGVVAWEHMYQYAPGITAAIEFNGTWHRPAGSDYFTLICEEHPWIFWVDLDGTLMAQYGPYNTEAFILATGVSTVKAVRGYKSEEAIYQDQGLVVVYLKGGKAYYRNLCVQPFGDTAWEEERELTQLGTGIVDIHVHRLNDYRLGIVSTSATGNNWLVTERTYIAGAVLPENIRGSINDFSIVVTRTMRHSSYHVENLASSVGQLYIGFAKPIEPYLASAYNILDETTEVFVKFSDSLVENLTGLQNYFTLKDAKNVSYRVLTTGQGIDKSEIVLNTVNFGGATNPMTLSYNNAVTVNNLVPLLTVEVDNVRFAVPSTEVVFDVLKEPPVGFISDSIYASTAFNMIVTSITYSNVRTGNEYIEATTSMTSIVVTKVGTDPL